MKHTVVALVQDRPGVLNRVASVFRRRELNIESLTVARTHEAGVSQMTLVTESENITPVVAQLEKLIDVFEVHVKDAVSFTSDAVFISPATQPLLNQADGIA